MSPDFYNFQRQKNEFVTIIRINEVVIEMFLHSVIFVHIVPG